MNCTDLKQHLMPYADGELEPTLAAEVDSALGDCPECREELAEIRRIAALSRHAFLAPVEAANLAGVYDGVMARLGQGDAARASAAPGLWARFTGWLSEVGRFERPLLLAGAAALALALVVGIALSSGSDEVPARRDSGVANVEPKRRGAEEEVKAMGRNTAYVEHLEAEKGEAYVEFNQDDPEAPMVLWHVVEEDAPKGL